MRTCRILLDRWNIASNGPDELQKSILVKYVITHTFGFLFFFLDFFLINNYSFLARLDCEFTYLENCSHISYTSRWVYIKLFWCIFISDWRRKTIASSSNDANVRQNNMLDTKSANRFYRFHYQRHGRGMGWSVTLISWMLYKRMYCYHEHNFIYSIHQYAGDSGIYETKLW